MSFSALPVLSPAFGRACCHIPGRGNLLGKQGLTGHDRRKSSGWHGTSRVLSSRGRLPLRNDSSLLVKFKKARTDRSLELVLQADDLRTRLCARGPAAAVSHGPRLRRLGRVSPLTTLVSCLRTAPGIPRSSSTSSCWLTRPVGLSRQTFTLNTSPSVGPDVGACVARRPRDLSEVRWRYALGRSYRDSGGRPPPDGAATHLYLPRARYVCQGPSEMRSVGAVCCSGTIASWRALVTLQRASPATRRAHCGPIDTVCSAPRRTFGTTGVSAVRSPYALAGGGCT